MMGWRAFGQILWWSDVHRDAHANFALGCCLSLIAGATNAGGFLAVGQYTSHMTGILSSVADNLVLGQTHLVLAGLSALLSFLLGAMTTAWMVNWGLRRGLRSTYARPLLLEAALLLVFGIFGSGIATLSHLFVPLTVLVLCFLMGLQNAVITKISGAQIRTTHVTGLVTDIGIELAKSLYVHGGRGRPVRANLSRLKLLSSLVVCFVAGGVLGALGFKFMGYSATLLLACVLLLIVAGPLVHDGRRGLWAPPIEP